MSTILDWDGKTLPATLRNAPAGRYILQRVDEAPALSAKDEEGLEQALRSATAGRTTSAESLKRRLRAIRRA
jgi:hypothetical protein